MGGLTRVSGVFYNSAKSFTLLPNYGTECAFFLFCCFRSALCSPCLIRLVLRALSAVPTRLGVSLFWLIAIRCLSRYYLRLLVSSCRSPVLSSAPTDLLFLRVSIASHFILLRVKMASGVALVPQVRVPRLACLSTLFLRRCSQDRLLPRRYCQVPILLLTTL